MLILLFSLTCPSKRPSGKRITASGIFRFFDFQVSETKQERFETDLMMAAKRGAIIRGRVRAVFSSHFHSFQLIYHTRTYYVHRDLYNFDLKRFILRSDKRMSERKAN